MSSCPSFLTSFSLAGAEPWVEFVSCSGPRGGAHGDHKQVQDVDAHLPERGCGPGCA